ncbi:MAG: PilZ domain-containing protein [Candidatus Omnitrophica bacterium]|nr:PilZ domain-containing protein [Candidatus Omnitrophota bacterium]
MQERRKFNRWQADKETFFKSEYDTRQTQVIDISPGGMRLVIDEWAGVGTPVSGRISLLSNQKPFYIQGEVVWVKQALDQLNRTCYIVGIRFNKIRTTPF